MIILIDNFDSFTYNLFQYLSQLGKEVLVVRNNEITLQQIEAHKPTHLIISPGPSTPENAGISLDAIRYFAGKLPILGVCLGHQAIAHAFGGKVIRARKVMHGKRSLIDHTGEGVFKDLNQPLWVTRYHSLIVEEESLPDCFDITAKVKNGTAGVKNGSADEKGNDLISEIMAIKHKTLQIEGVQFHPESILSEQGLALLSNFVNQ